MTTESTQSVLLIDEVALEGVCSTVAQAGRRYIRKFLRSLPSNWDVICELICGGTIDLVLAKFSRSTYRHFTTQGYEDAGDRLLRAIKSVPHAIFIYTGLFHENGTDDEGDDASSEVVGAVDPSITSFTDAAEYAAHVQKMHYFLEPNTRKRVNSLLIT